MSIGPPRRRNIRPGAVQGDLSTLREITCDPKRQEFTQWDGKEDQYRAIYEQQKGSRSADPDQPGHRGDDQRGRHRQRAGGGRQHQQASEQHDVIIVLRKVEGEWKVCNAE